MNKVNPFSSFNGNETKTKNSALERISRKTANILYTDRYATNRVAANYVSWFLNLVSFGSAAVGAKFILDSKSIDGYLSLGIIIFLLACLEIKGRFISDDYWDEKYLYGVTFSGKFFSWLVIFLISTSVSCWGVMVINEKTSAPDPYYENLRKELADNKASIKKKELENNTAENSDNNKVKGGIDDGKTYEHVLRAISKKKAIISKLEERNLELNKLLSSNPNPRTEGYEKDVKLRGYLLFFALVMMAIIFQYIMSFRSKYDAIAFKTFEPVKYFKSIRERKPHITVEQFNDFKEKHFLAYPTARKIYLEKTKSKNSKVVKPDFHKRAM